MLNFSKIKTILIYLIFFAVSVFAFLNLPINNSLFNKKINLGLDLQGGSYLLLEVDTAPLIEEKLQSKVILIKKFLNKKNYKYENFKVLKNSIKFSLDKKNIKSFESDFVSKKDNTINPYIDQYRTFELDLKTVNNEIEINFSKYGILTLNNSAVKQSIEIVRRRIDDLGTKNLQLFKEERNGLL